MKLLILDDDKEIRQGLKDTINWSECGIDHVDVAENGVQGLDYIRKESPHIALVDIKMPKMDGLEFSYQAKEINANIHIIILTSYSNFEYARRAIQLGIKEFLLKPIDISQLMGVVKLQVEEIRNIELEQSQYEDYKEFMSYIHDAAKAYIYKKFNGYIPFELENKDYENDIIKNLNCRLGILVSLDKIIMNNVINRIENENAYELITIKHEEVVFLFFIDMSNKSQQQEIQKKHNKSIIKKLEVSIKKTNGVRIGLSKMGTLEEIKDLIRDTAYSIASYEGNFGLNRGKLIHYSWLRKKKTIKEYKEINYFVKHNKKSHLNDFMTHYLLSNNQKLELIKNEIYHIMKYIMSIYIIEGKFLYQYLIEYRKKINGCKSKSLLKSIVSKYIEGLPVICYHEHESQDKSNWVIEQAKQYIQSNYKKNISLIDVATDINRNATYLSYLFKKEVGIGIVEYINQIRINKAKGLLLNKDLLIYEVAEKIGFSDYRYFSSNFKKKTGLSPTAFREKHF